MTRVGESAGMETGDDGIVITRIFDASRERVWREWTTPERFADWYGGREAEIPLETVSMDVRVGGKWEATMIVGGREIHWHGEYREVREPARLVLTVSDQPGDADELLTVVLTDVGDGSTQMRFTQTGGGLTAEGYERAGQGWTGFFDTMEESLPSG